MFYNTIVPLAPAAGAMAVNVFRCNSIYDPDLTGVGVSAFSYTQLSALYGRYRVLSFRARMMFVNLSTSVPLTVLAAVNPVNTIGTNFTNACAQRHIWTKSIATATGQGCVSHTVSGPIGFYYGVPESQVRDEDDYASVTGTNPNNVVYLHVGAYANGGAAGSLNVHVRMEYDVVWSLPLEMS